MRDKIIGVFGTQELDPDVTFIEPDGDRVGRGQFDLYLVSHAVRTRIASSSTLQLLHWLLVYQRRGGDAVRDEHEPGVRLDELQLVQPPRAHHTPLLIDEVQGQALASPQHPA